MAAAAAASSPSSTQPLLHLKKPWRLLFLLLVVVLCINGEGSPGTTSTTTTTTWCVSRSNVTEAELQTALDYACGSGADCTPIQPNGLCFLPNTFQAHASYAFNSYYQRKSMAPSSCDFAGTATISITDPSYGSCVYPSSSSTAGGAITQPTPPMTPTDPNAPMNPTTTSTPIYGGGIGGPGFGLGPSTPGSSNSNTYSSQSSLLPPSTTTIIALLSMNFMYIFVPSFPFRPYYFVHFKGNSILFWRGW